MWYSVCELLHVHSTSQWRKVLHKMNKDHNVQSSSSWYRRQAGWSSQSVSAHSRSGQVQCSGSVKAWRRDRSTTSALSRCDRGDLDPLWHHEHRLHRYRTVDIGSAGKQSTYRCLQLRRGHVHNHDCGRGSVCVAVSTEWISHVSYILYV